jgi:hypothetical protein
MMPGAIKQLAPLLAETVGSFAAGQGVAQYAVPAVAKSGGLFGGKRVSVPLSEPLPGVDVPKYVAPAAANLEVRAGAARAVGGGGLGRRSSGSRVCARGGASGHGAGPRAAGPADRGAVSTNPTPLRQTGVIEGVKAAALDAGGPNVAVAVFVGAGSACETPATAGASKLLEYMAFSATANRCEGQRRRRRWQKFRTIPSAGGRAGEVLAVRGQQPRARRSIGGGGAAAAALPPCLTLPRAPSPPRPLSLAPPTPQRQLHLPPYARAGEVRRCRRRARGARVHRLRCGGHQAAGGGGHRDAAGLGAQHEVGGGLHGFAWRQRLACRQQGRHSRRWRQAPAPDSSCAAARGLRRQCNPTQQSHTPPPPPTPSLHPPRLNYWEINDMLPHVQADMERAYSQPTVLATELLHR